MTQPPTRHPQYAADHQTLAASPAPDWLAHLRAQGWQQFNALGLPTARRGNERWKYTSIAPIARIQFAYPFTHDAAPNPQPDFGFPQPPPPPTTPPPNRTHHQRMLNYIRPDQVDGRIIRPGGPELALELEEKGYDWIRPEMEAA